MFFSAGERIKNKLDVLIIQKGTGIANRKGISKSGAPQTNIQANMLIVLVN